MTVGITLAGARGATYELGDASRDALHVGVGHAHRAGAGRGVGPAAAHRSAASELGDAEP